MKKFLLVSNIIIYVFLSVIIIIYHIPHSFKSIQIHVLYLYYPYYLSIQQSHYSNL
jgi:hypothetical protein